MTPPTIKITFHEASKLKRPVRVFPATATRIAPYSNIPWAYIIPTASGPVLDVYVLPLRCGTIKPITASSSSLSHRLAEDSVAINSALSYKIVRSKFSSSYLPSCISLDNTSDFFINIPRIIPKNTEIKYHIGNQIRMFMFSFVSLIHEFQPNRAIRLRSYKPLILTVTGIISAMSPFIFNAGRWGAGRFARSRSRRVCLRCRLDAEARQEPGSPPF